MITRLRSIVLLDERWKKSNEFNIISSSNTVPPTEPASPSDRDVSPFMQSPVPLTLFWIVCGQGRNCPLGPWMQASNSVSETLKHVRRLLLLLN